MPGLLKHYSSLILRHETCTGETISTICTGLLRTTFQESPSFVKSKPGLLCRLRHSGLQKGHAVNREPVRWQSPAAQSRQSGGSGASLCCVHSACLSLDLPDFHNACMLLYQQFCNVYLLPKISKLEEVVPALFHPVGPPVPKPVRLAQQDRLITPCSSPVPRGQVLQGLDLHGIT